MLDRDSDRLPPALRRISGAFRLFGWVSFWAQAVLAVVSTLVLVFSSVVIGFQTTGQQGPRDNPGAGAGLFLAILGLLGLYAGVYWAFRYTRLARKLRAIDGRDRPKPGDVIQTLRLGLIINLVGMLLTLLGGEALIGSLVAKALSQPQGRAFFENITQAIQPLDIWVVQANINIALAHFIGIAISLWLVQVMGRQ
ncbi:MAG: DUF3611 family protein [Leptolyngbyaceae bacterium]|nr:DUF3611 family protein [Leptolyngbyaceae bacterium]